MSARARRADVAGFGLGLLAALAALWWRWSELPHSLSAEQAESLALARNVVAWIGPRLTEFSSTLPGGPSLAWFSVQALVVLGQGDPAVWLPRIALGFLGVSLGLGAAWSAVASRRGVRVEDALPFVALAGSTALAEAGARGSGAALWAAALAGAAVLGSWAHRRGRAVVAGAALGALCLVRLEAVWLLLGSAPAWWLGARLEGRRALREAALYVAAGLGAVAVVFLVRQVVFGSVPLQGLLPEAAGLGATTEFLTRQSRWAWAAVTGLLVMTVWQRFHLRGGGLLVSWVVMTLVLSTWSHAARPLFLGVLPLLGMLVAAGLSAARDGPIAEEGVPRQVRQLSRLAFLGQLGLVLLAGSHAFVLGPVMLEAHVPRVPPEFSGELRARGLQQPFVVWSEGAEAAALFPRARVVVAKAWTPALVDLVVTEGPPDVVDGRLGMEGAGALRAVLAPGPGEAWWLAEQSPDDDPRCPEGRLALLSETPEGLAALVERDLGDEQVARALLRWRCALAALEPSQLPSAAQRAALTASALRQAERFEREGRLELAVRAASLAATVSGELVPLRARAERLREAWLARVPEK